GPTGALGGREPVGESAAGRGNHEPGPDPAGLGHATSDGEEDGRACRAVEHSPDRRAERAAEPERGALDKRLARRLELVGQQPGYDQDPGAEKRAKADTGQDAGRVDGKWRRQESPDPDRQAVGDTTDHDDPAKPEPSGGPGDE